MRVRKRNITVILKKESVKLNTWVLSFAVRDKWWVLLQTICLMALRIPQKAGKLQSDW